jgi:hydrogenase-4 component F
MILLILLILPLLSSAACWAWRGGPRTLGRASAAGAGAGFILGLFLSGRVLGAGSVGFGRGDFLRADGLSAVMVLVVTLVAWISLWAGEGMLRRARDREELSDAHLRRYYVLTNLFLFTMLLSVTANNVGVMWVAVEATTITTAFLIGLENSREALEASWKYILIGSVGIALAFVGTVLGYFDFVQRVGETPHALHWSVLSGVAERLNGDVLRIAFVFILVGYGTKAGIAPMHTWLPDAHSEAPAPTSSMMSGSLLVVAFYAILRWKVVVDACVGTVFSDRMLILTGTLSVAVAAILMIRQMSYKRMLAYSSVEHVGLMCVGAGLGPPGVLAALLHMVGHAAGKSMLFLLSGIIKEAYGSTRIVLVRGLLRARPWTGALFLAGTLALLGLPPFSLFLSELMIFRAGFLAGRAVLTGLLMLFTLVIFVFFLGYVNRILYGQPPAEVQAATGSGAADLAPLAVNLGVLLAAGIVIPPPLLSLLRLATEVIHP